MSNSHHVIIVGAGFGGIQVALNLRLPNVKITLIDRQNYHLFQPLLYQAATALLAPSEIAWPIRHLMRKRPDVTTLMAAVSSVDKYSKSLTLESGEVLKYDSLVLSTGARHAYFGHDQWAEYAPGLKALDDATRIRENILLAFEKAECENDEQHQKAWLTFVIVGAGPTGVELAGTIAELAHHTLKEEFRRIDSTHARVVLIEASATVLPTFKNSLSQYAHTALEELGVDIMLGEPVSSCDENGVMIGTRRLQAKTILWAAGVQASPANEWLGVSSDEAGRVQVEPDLTAPGNPEIFVIGDTAAIKTKKGGQVPGIAPAAKQQGRYVANFIKARLLGKKLPGPFCYRHFGDLATIGKRAAVFDLGWIKLRGRIAWWLWGIAHIYFLIGLKNRLMVSLHWLWIYFKGDRGARLITRSEHKGE